MICGRIYKGIIFILLPYCLLFVLAEIESWLLKAGVLNTKDLGFVGGEEGSPYEYILNIWYWDAALAFLTVIVIIYSIIMMFKFIRSRKPV